MVQRETRPRPPLPVLATGVGGLVVVLAALLPWHALSVQPTFLRGLTGGALFTQSVPGTQGTDGKVALIGGIVLIVAAVVMWTSQSERTYRVMAIVAIVVAAIVALIVLVDIVGGDSIFKAFFRKSVRSFAQKNTGLAPSNDQIDSFRSVLGIELHLRAAIVVALIADLVALAGGVMALRSRRQGVAAPPA